MKFESKLIRIGNSYGIVLPIAIAKCYNVGSKVVGDFKILEDNDEHS